MPSIHHLNPQNLKYLLKKIQFPRPHVQISQIHNNADLICPWSRDWPSDLPQSETRIVLQWNMGSSIRNNIFGVGGWTFFILSAGGKIAYNSKHTHYPWYKTPTLLQKKYLIFVLISVQDLRKKWLPFYIHACQLISLISSARKCIECAVGD